MVQGKLVAKSESLKKDSINQQIWAELELYLSNLCLHHHAVFNYFDFATSIMMFVNCAFPPNDLQQAFTSYF
jgi:hypothetical protein